MVLLIILYQPSTLCDTSKVSIHQNQRFVFLFLLLFCILFVVLLVVLSKTKIDIANTELYSLFNHGWICCIQIIQLWYNYKVLMDQTTANSQQYMNHENQKNCKHLSKNLLEKLINIHCINGNIHL